MIIYIHACGTQIITNNSISDPLFANIVAFIILQCVLLTTAIIYSVFCFSYYIFCDAIILEF